MTTKNKKRSGRQGGAANTALSTTVVVKQKGRGKPDSRPAGNRQTIVPSNEDVKKVCSLVDPFCSHAIGAKYMTFTMARSLSVPSHSRVSITTTGLGSASALILPNYYYYPYVVGSFPVDSLNARFDTFDGTSSLPSALSTRLVTCGFKVRYIGAPLYASGVVRIRVFNARDGQGFLHIATGTYNCDQYADIPCSAFQGRDVSVTLHRTTPDAEFWRTNSQVTPSNAAIGWVSPGFQCAMVSIEGGPADGPCLELEFFLNYEIQLFDSDSMAQLAQPGPPNLPHITQAANHYTSTAKSIFAQIGGDVSQYATKMVTNGLKGAVRSGMLAIGLA